MRTSIVLSDELVAEAMRYSSASSKRALVEEALRTFIEVRAAEQRRAPHRERLEQLERRLEGIRLRENPREVLRADRNR